MEQSGACVFRPAPMRHECCFALKPLIWLVAIHDHAKVDAAALVRDHADRPVVTCFEQFLTPAVLLLVPPQRTKGLNLIPKLGVDDLGKYCDARSQDQRALEFGERDD
jgi:hypothetical protein